MQTIESKTALNGVGGRSFSFFQFPSSFHQKSFLREEEKIHRHLAFKLNCLTPCGLPSRRWKLFFIKSLIFLFILTFHTICEWKCFPFFSLSLTRDSFVLCVAQKKGQKSFSFSSYDFYLLFIRVGIGLLKRDLEVEAVSDGGMCNSEVT
jgi:hypothetical protein